MEGDNRVYKCIDCKEIWKPSNKDNEDIDPKTDTTYNKKCRECRLKLLKKYTKSLGFYFCDCHYC